MTDEEILALSIADLEREIAKRIFDLTIHARDGNSYVARFGLREGELPQYAHDIRAAKRATDTVLYGWPGLGLNVYFGYSTEGPRYSATIAGVTFPGAREVHVRVEAATEEEARARAALMAYWRMK